MKKVLFVVCFVLAGMASQGQTLEEWFEQKKTQKKCLLQQIAAFRVYLGSIQKGYTISKEGLTAISDIKKGDFALHQDYFSTLNAVGPKVGRYTKVAEVMALQQEIVKGYKAISKRVLVKEAFTAKEADYILVVLQNLLDDCNAAVVELTTVITPNELQMKDDERLMRIDEIFRMMQENYTFLSAFASETKLLAAQRKKEKADIHSSRVLNDIKNK